MSMITCVTHVNTGIMRISRVPFQTPQVFYIKFALFKTTIAH